MLKKIKHSLSLKKNIRKCNEKEDSLDYSKTWIIGSFSKKYAASVRKVQHFDEEYKRLLNSNSNSHEEIKSTTKRKYRGKYKDSICVFLFVTRFFWFKKTTA